MPRPLLGARKLTPAERQARQRAAKAAKERLLLDGLARIRNARTLAEARTIADAVMYPPHR